MPVVPEKTRIAFQVRMTLLRAIQTISPGNNVHQFRIETPDQLDDRVSEWLREAYAVGQQQHLRTRRGPAPLTQAQAPDFRTELSRYSTLLR